MTIVERDLSKGDDGATDWIGDDVDVLINNAGVQVIGRTAYLTVRTFSGGRISGGGRFLSSVSKRVSRATNATTLKVPLSAAGRRHRRLTTTVRVGFVPSNHTAHSSASVRVRFR